MTQNEIRFAAVQAKRLLGAEAISIAERISEEFADDGFERMAGNWRRIGVAIERLQQKAEPSDDHQ
jgi:hypothetical protein